MLDRKVIVRILSFSAYFVTAFLIFLLFLFPFDRVKSRIESEVRARTPLDLTVSHISPRFFDRFVMQDVVVSDRATGRVFFESPAVRANVSLLGLLRGFLSVELNGPAYGGTLYVKVRQGGKKQSLIIDGSNFDIGSYTLFKDLGLKLGGTLGGNLELAGGSGKGRLWLKDLSWRGLTVKGIPVPDMDFEQGWLETELKGDRLTVKKLELDGKELKVRVNGDAFLRDRGALNLAVKVKPSERLSREQAGLFGLLKNKDGEGFYQFMLGGTVDQPMPRL